MVDCSKTEMFLQEYARMCKQRECSKCALSAENNYTHSMCHEFVKKCPKEAIRIVQKWSDEHQTKTRQSEFLKHYPNAYIINDVINFCPAHIDTTTKCDIKKHKSCLYCMQEYWLAEVE